MLRIQGHELKNVKHCCLKKTQQSLSNFISKKTNGTLTQTVKWHVEYMSSWVKGIAVISQL